MGFNHFSYAKRLLTCSYKSSNIFLGSLSCETWGNTASHLPLLISAINVSRLSTVLRETWHSFCSVWKVWCKEFSLQNWRIILITLHEKGKENILFVALLGSWRSEETCKKHIGLWTKRKKGTRTIGVEGHDHKIIRFQNKRKKLPQQMLKDN